MGEYQYIFSPITIKNVEFKNRLEVAPQSTLLATPDGLVTADLIEYYRPYARGGFGIVTIGESLIDFDYPPRHHFSINLGTDKVITGLSELVEAISRYGAQISIEISHPGRHAPFFPGRNPIGPSPIPPPSEELIAAKERRPPIKVVEMDEDMIYEVIQKFARAAKRCQNAGFNMIMLHGAHGHLLAQFLSPHSNKRRDRWGGSLENRARFPISVIEEIRKTCGEDLIIEYRLSLDEKIPDGLKPDEAIEFIKMIKGKVDIIHVSAGILANPETVQHMIQPSYTEHMYNVHLARLVKEQVDVLVTAVGSIMNLDEAETIIRNGWADFVAFARPAFADPEMPRKGAKGEKDKIRPCIRCNFCTYLSSKLMNHRCTVNPMAGRGREFNQTEGLQPARKKRKVMVVGGGPGGMQAAQTAFQRGHEVVLYEKGESLGGLLRVACKLPFKRDLKNYLDWMIQQTEKSRIRVVFNTDVNADLVKMESPDALIIAVGAEPLFPDVPGIRQRNVVWAGDTYSNEGYLGKTIIVVGAGYTGLETAVFLASKGKKVTIIEMMGADALFSDVGSAHKFYLLDRIKEYDIKIVPDTRLIEVTDSGIKTIDRALNLRDYEAETIVIATGMRPRKEKVQELRRLVPETEVYIIGDCKKPRKLFHAIHEGFNAACEL
ncbi:MAG: FAD-dependent oxidoreductase [candidate division WOR-3 bacterium]